jgi:hypothetical protein
MCVSGGAGFYDYQDIFGINVFKFGIQVIENYFPGL